MIKTTARILERSVASNIGSWLAQERTRELGEISNPVRRKLGEKMLIFAQRMPNVASGTLDILARTHGYRYLGAGVEFSTYLRTADLMAVKVHRSSAGMPQESLVDLKKEKDEGFELLSRYLGSSILPQTVKIAEHVLGGGYPTVQVEQPFVSFHDDDTPFRVTEEDIDIQRLAGLVERIPGIDSAFTELIERSRIMYDEKELLPDTNGTNNIVAQPSADLILIDSTPIGSEHPGIQQLIMTQLDSLEIGLREVA